MKSSLLGGFAIATTLLIQSAPASSQGVYRAGHPRPSYSYAGHGSWSRPGAISTSRLLCARSEPGIWHRGRRRGRGDGRPNRRSHRFSEPRLLLPR